MTVKGTNLSMIKGDTEVISVVLTEEGKRKNFSKGDTIYFTMKKYISDKEKVIQKVVTDFQEGAGVIQIEPSDTKDLSARVYYYDVQITFASGEVKTVVEPSEFRIKDGVTDE